MKIKPARAVSVNHYGTAAMLQLISTVNGNTDVGARQKAIEFVALIHGIDLANTKSLRYQPSFAARDGRNVNRDIIIGPSAFVQDSAWLATVVYHEVVHSDQFLEYDKQGVGSIDPKNSGPERVLVSLDEYEAWFSTLFNRTALGLNQTQIASVQRELALWMIDIGDESTKQLAQRKQFEAARTALIAQVLSARKSKGQATGAKNVQTSASIGLRRPCCRQVV